MTKTKMTTSSANTLKSARPHIQAIASRADDAWATMTESMVEQFDVTQEQARKAIATLLRHRLIRLDYGIGCFQMVHGRVWEKDVILRAAAEVK